VILPGVGAFGDCLANLRKLKLEEAIRKFVGSGRPFLGICLGFQALFESSAEAPGVEGLSIFAGSVPRFAVNGLKVPHMGWNQLHVRQTGCPLLAGIEDNPYVYFVHSYYCRPNDQAVICGTTDYGGEFCSMLWKGNMFATQFHPEKSQAIGLTMLANFVGLVKK
jgi:glutamine amidotransferase